MRMNRLAAILLIAGSIVSAHAGPPMVCHEISIGEAKSLPWDGGHGGSDSSYDTRSLARDTVKLLGAQTSGLVRMETIRRAAVYISHEKAAARDRLAWELLATLTDRALEGEATGKRGPAAWFDAGYLIGCYNQLGLDIGQRMGESDGIPGYGYVLKGIELSRTIQQATPAEIAELEFGAALITHPAMRAKGRAIKAGDEDVYDAHLRRAVAAVQKGSPLEINLAAHLKLWGKSMDAYRTTTGPGEIAGRR